jgi:hypothetical protein
MSKNRIQRKQKKYISKLASKTPEVNSTGLIKLQTKTYDQKSVLSLLAQNKGKLAS